MAGQKKVKASEKAKEIHFEYIKSNQFRVVAMDGAFGGLSPNGKEIRMAIFNERRPIPRKTVHPIGVGGVLGKEDVSRRESRKSFIREVEVEIALDLQAAINLQTWLVDKIQQLAKQHGIEITPVAAGGKNEKKLKANGRKVHDA